MRGGVFQRLAGLETEYVARFRADEDSERPLTFELLQKLADFAGSGKLRIGIGRTAKLDDAIAMLSDLEAGRRTKGKAVIVME